MPATLSWSLNVSALAVRCSECRRENRRFCQHNGVLLVYINSAPVVVVSDSEESAQLTADRLRVKIKGKPFNKKSVAWDDVCTR